MQAQELALEHYDGLSIVLCLPENIMGDCPGMLQTYAGLMIKYINVNSHIEISMLVDNVDVIIIPLSAGCEFAGKLMSQIDSSVSAVTTFLLLEHYDEKDVVYAYQVGFDDYVINTKNKEYIDLKITKTYFNKKLFRKLVSQRNELQKIYEENDSALDIVEKTINAISKPVTTDSVKESYIVSPMGKLSGDVILHAVTPDNRMLYLIADFTGHGVAAAIGTIIVGQIFYAMTGKSKKMTDIIVEVNKKLLKYLPTGRYMAAAFIEISPENIIKVVNMGLPEIFIFDESNKIIGSVSSTEMPLGIIDLIKESLNISKYVLKTDSKLIAYTDGIIESMNSKNEFYGKDRLLTDLSTSTNGIHGVMHSIEKFSNGVMQSDDMTLLEVRVDRNKCLN